jgi:hypothetical protein
MNKRFFVYVLAILLLMRYSQTFVNAHYSGFLFAQDVNTTASQKNIKREKKRRMKEAVKADNAALKRHHDIQTKATRKRMKTHLKQTKKNVKNSHR